MHMSIYRPMHCRYTGQYTGQCTVNILVNILVNALSTYRSIHQQAHALIHMIPPHSKCCPTDSLTRMHTAPGPHKNPTPWPKQLAVVASAVAVVRSGR